MKKTSINTVAVDFIENFIIFWNNSYFKGLEVLVDDDIVLITPNFKLQNEDFVQLKLEGREEVLAHFKKVHSALPLNMQDKGILKIEGRRITSEVYYYCIQSKGVIQFELNNYGRIINLKIDIIGNHHHKKLNKLVVFKNIILHRIKLLVGSRSFYQRPYNLSIPMNWVKDLLSPTTKSVN